MSNETEYTVERLPSGFYKVYSSRVVGVCVAGTEKRAIEMYKDYVQRVEAQIKQKTRGNKNEK